MTFLVLTILAAIAIAAILRYNERRGGDRWVVAGCNYAVATALSLALAPGDGGRLTSAQIAFGVLVGAGFVGGFIAGMRAMREIGMAVPATTARLSTLVPVIGSIVLYDEMPSALQIAGIGVGVGAFVVLGAAQRRRQGDRAIGTRGLWLLVAIFAISGCVDFSMKVAQESGSTRGPFLALVFATAMAICATAVGLRRRRIRLSDAAVGIALGIPNFLASYFVLRALAVLSGVVVFPAMNASVVLGVTAVAILVWREVPGAATAVGLALAACAVVLLGLG
jgi:drug/metabolite transporter (DMT)-like permease